MNTFYGDPYIESRWTRFDNFQALFGFESERTRAFREWWAKVLISLKKDNDVVVVVTSDNPDQWVPTTQILVSLPKIFPEFQVLISLIHYDTLTKMKMDPAQWVIDSVKRERQLQDNWGK